MASKAASGLSGLAEIRELSNCTCWRRERGRREGEMVEGRTGGRGRDSGREDRWEREREGGRDREREGEEEKRLMRKRGE